MVKEKIISGKEYHFCEECGLAYQDNKKACECEKWCRKHKSCNLEVTKYALNKNE